MFYIMSYNQIAGFNCGSFQDLNLLFYAGPAEDPCGRRWVPVISQALGFDSSEAAKEAIQTVWGPRMAFGVFEYDEIDSGRDKLGLKRMKMYEDFGRELVTKRALPESLIVQAENFHASPISGMTWRERWIIEIFAEKLKRMRNTQTPKGPSAY